MTSNSDQPIVTTTASVSYVNFTPTVTYSANTNVNYTVKLSSGYSVVMLINPGNSLNSGTPKSFYTINGQECFNQVSTDDSNVYIDPRFYEYKIKMLKCIIPVNQWSLVIFTVDTTGKGSVFLNNNTTSTKSINGSSIPKPPITFNTPSINSDGYNSFKLAALAFYNKALTTTQINTIYNSISGIIGTNL